MKTITKKQNYKKLYALIMCMVVAIFAMSAGVSAIGSDQDIDVTFYKSSNPTQLSMADECVAGTAFYDIDTETLTIPIQYIEETYLLITHYGYIEKLEVDTDGDTDNGYEVTAYPDATPYPNGGSISIPLAANLVTDGCTFNVRFGIDLYYNQAGTIPAIYSHITPTAIMQLDYV